MCHNWRKKCRGIFERLNDISFVLEALGEGNVKREATFVLKDPLVEPFLQSLDKWLYDYHGTKNTLPPDAIRVSVSECSERQTEMVVEEVVFATGSTKALIATCNVVGLQICLIVNDSTPTQAKWRWDVGSAFWKSSFQPNERIGL